MRMMLIIKLSLLLKISTSNCNRLTNVSNELNGIQFPVIGFHYVVDSIFPDIGCHFTLQRNDSSSQLIG